MKWFLGSFLLWLAYQGRLASYILLATTGTQTTNPSQPPATVNNATGATNTVSAIANSPVIQGLLP